MADVTGGLSDLLQAMLLLLVGGAVVAGGGCLHGSKQGATADAVEVDATVGSSQVVHTAQRQDPGASVDVYSPRVRYRYTCEGETDTSTNLRPGAGSGRDRPGAGRTEAWPRSASRTTPRTGR